MVALTALGALVATKGLEKASEILVEALFNFYKSENEKGFRNNEIEDIFKEYEKISVKRNLYINSVAFRAQDKKFTELYYPLTIVSEFTRLPFKIKFEDACLDEVFHYNPMMIVDNAGMGKSTLAQYLFNLCLVRKNAIPIIVPLRNLSEENDLWKDLYKQFDLLDRQLEIEDIKRQLKIGGFLIILDGFDEVKDSEKRSVSKCIQDLVTVADKNYYVLTSREDSVLTSFSGFSHFSIKKFDYEEACLYLKRIGNDDDCSKELIEHIMKDTSTISEFIGNPLMLSLLYRSYSFNRTIPATKKEFYYSVYAALFQDHDTTKNGFVRPKESGLSLEEFESVLRGLGWLSIQNEQIEFQKSELLGFIKESIDSADRVDAKPEEILQDLVKNVPLFEHIGFDQYKWCHKSFSEYFAARCIFEDFTPEQKKDIFEQMFFSLSEFLRNKNIFDFLEEIDPKACRDYLYIPFLETLLKDVPEDENLQYDMLISLDAYISPCAMPNDYFMFKPTEQFWSPLNYIENAGYSIRDIIPNKYINNLFDEKSVLLNGIPVLCYVYNNKKASISKGMNLDVDPADFVEYISFSDEPESFTTYIRKGAESTHTIITFEKLKDVLEIMRMDRDHTKKGRFTITRPKKK